MTTELISPVTRSASRGRGTVLVVLASVAFGTSGPLAKPIMDAGLSPQQVAGIRIGLAALGLLVVVGLTRPKLLRLRGTQWRIIVAYGVIAVAAVQVVYFIAVSRIPIGVAMLLEYTAPVLVALWVRFVRGTVLPSRAWLGTALAFGGLVLVAQVWQGLAFDAIGMLAGAAAAFGAASYYLIGSHAVDTIEPLGLVTWGMVVGAVAIAVFVPPWTIPAGVFDDPAAFGPWHPPVWVLVVGIALLSTALAYLLSISAMRHLPANVVSVLALVEPIVAAGAAWIFLGQSLTAVQVLGAAVLLAGATIVQLNSSARGQDQVEQGGGVQVLVDGIGQPVEHALSEGAEAGCVGRR
ncbi:MAG TPA: EamA family transporter [Actinophytocola sp.]|nr:EamA family transporter [Actinophytocola sp.]HEU5470562.1 EamA family transporter [Actinophytocola sp.]